MSSPKKHPPKSFFFKYRSGRLIGYLRYFIILSVLRKISIDVIPLSKDVVWLSMPYWNGSFFTNSVMVFPSSLMGKPSAVSGRDANSSTVWNDACILWIAVISVNIFTFYLQQESVYKLVRINNRSCFQLLEQAATASYVTGHSFSTYAKFSGKINISYPLTRKRGSAYHGVRNVSFSENFAHVLNG